MASFDLKNDLKNDLVKKNSTKGIGILAFKILNVCEVT